MRSRTGDSRRRSACGRSPRHLIELKNDLEGQGIGFQSITEAMDTTSSGGTLVFHIFAKIFFDAPRGVA